MQIKTEVSGSRVLGVPYQIEDNSLIQLNPNCMFVKVTHVGSGRLLRNGLREQAEVGVGDVITYSKDSGSALISTIFVDGKEYLEIPFMNILGIVE